LTTAGQLAAIGRYVQYGCSRAAETLAARAPKSLTVSSSAANQAA